MLTAQDPVKEKLKALPPKPGCYIFKGEDGKILYVGSSEDKPLPTYAVYEAGSHCSTTIASKQEDVFVTEVNYLVHLR